MFGLFKKKPEKMYRVVKRTYNSGKTVFIIEKKTYGMAGLYWSEYFGTKTNRFKSEIVAKKRSVELNMEYFLDEYKDKVIG